MPGEIEHLFGENKQILGWVHTHTRGVNCFFSSLDVHTQFTYQQMCSDFLGIVCELSEDNFFINQVLEQQQFDRGNYKCFKVVLLDMNYVW